MFSYGFPPVHLLLPQIHALLLVYLEFMLGADQATIRDIMRGGSPKKKTARRKTKKSTFDIPQNIPAQTDSRKKIVPPPPITFLMVGPLMINIMMSP
jgi:hypothetical protein